MEGGWVGWMEGKEGWMEEVDEVDGGLVASGLAGRRVDGKGLVDEGQRWRRVGWRAGGWRLQGWLEGWLLKEGWMEGGLAGLRASEMRFGSRGSILCVGSAVRGFCGSQGWTVLGVSVPVCGSVRGLPKLGLGLSVARYHPGPRWPI